MIRRIMSCSAISIAISAAALGAAEDTPLSENKARIYTPGAIERSTEPLRLNAGPHLFIDDYLVETSQYIERVVNVPARGPAIPNPVVTGAEDGCFQPYMTIVRDPETNRFRIWYGHRTEDMNSTRSRLAYMESDDGIHWERPARVLEDPAPIQFGVSIIDDGPHYEPASRRYKYGWHMDGGLKVAASSDGLAWTPLAPEPVLRHNHDINGIYRDPIRNRYVATISVYRPGGWWGDGRRRISMQSTSADLLEWSPPHYIVLPDPNVDEGETQFYAMDGYLARGELLIGMVKVLRDDLKADDPPNPADAYGVGYTTLAWSRDGETWTRDPVHFFDPHPTPGAWDHAHAWIDEQVLVDDEIFLYYGGYARGHKVNRFEERQIGLLKMPRDRYVARAAGSERGLLRTPAIVTDAKAMTVNADGSKGSLRVQLSDENGAAIPGFAFDDCSPISSNGIDIPVKWKSDLPAVAGRPVHIEMELERARVFAFTLSD